MKVQAKLADDFAAGVRQVWLVVPEQRTITLYRSLTEIQVLTETDELASEDLFPGFRCPVAAIFRTPGHRVPAARS